MPTATVLVVEDCHDIRAMLVRLLRNGGVATLEAHNGLEAVRIARRHPPALILMDIGLPGIDGIEVASQIRADPLLEDIPIVLITAYVTSSAEQIARKAGCQGILFKPFDLTAFSQQVASLLPVGIQSLPSLAA